MALMTYLRHMFARTSGAPGEHGGNTARAPDCASAADLARLLRDARACRKRRAWADAIELLEQACDLAPESAEVHLALGQAQASAARNQDAIDSYHLALHYDPDCMDAAFGLSKLLAAGGRTGEAIACLQDAVVRHPRSAPLHAELGLRLTEAEQIDEARRVLDTAVEIDATYGPAWHNRAYLELLVGQPEAALQDFRAAAKLAPAQVESQVGIAHALRDLGRLGEAMNRYRRIIERNRTCEDAINNLALTQLLSGRLDEGFRNYEWRFGPPGPAPRGFPFPVWRGQPLGGKHILVYAEQGIGDEVMFASCILDLLAQGAQCTIECSERLAALFQRSFPAAAIHGGRKTDSLDWLDGIPAADYQSPIGSLPRYVRRTAASFSDHSGYLTADPGRVESWRSRLAKLPGAARIGLSWRGGTLKSKRHTRSMPLSLLAPLFDVPGAAFVSLQHDAVPDQELAHAQRLHCFDEPMHDLEELAALIRALDLVISVDNTNVHLAGALGAPVWVLLPHVPDWRYGMTGAAMPWYPSARLYRQAQRAQWSSVVDEVARDLMHRIDGGGASCDSLVREGLLLS